jgi:hypothetical protein
MARRLMDSGVLHVRPLLGGLDAWIEGGFPVEEKLVEIP